MFFFFLVVLLERGKGCLETAYQSALAEAVEDWVTGAVSSPKKFDSDEDVTNPASIALTLEESNSSGGGR